jgi:hypothetical protein
MKSNSQPVSGMNERNDPVSRLRFMYYKVKLLQYSRGELAFRLFVTCWFIYALHFATNTVREIYPALSLGDHLSFDVSEYVGLHPDIFTIPGRGSFINNNPGASILGAIPYALTRPIVDYVVNRVQQERLTHPGSEPTYDSIYPLSREFYKKAYERGLDVKFGLAAGVMSTLLMAPLSALSVVLMFYILLTLTHKTKQSFFLALLYAFATPVFYRTAQLNQNLLQSHFALFAFVLLWRPWDNSNNILKRYWLLAGLLIGFTLVLDYSGTVIILAFSLYAFVRWSSIPKSIRHVSDLLIFGLGVTACVSILLTYQWLAFGNPIFPAQHYMPPTTYSGMGFNGMTLPQPDLFIELMFGMRYGLFTSAPFLLLALYIPAWFRRDLRLLENRETVFIVLFSFAFFLFTSANQFARMQFNTGVRHVIPVTPFLFLIAAGVLLHITKWIALLFGVIATYWSWCLAMYRDVEQGSGVFESLIHITTGGPRLPWLTTLQNLGLAPHWMTALLILFIGGIILWVVWVVQLPNFENKRWIRKLVRGNYR